MNVLPFYLISNWAYFTITWTIFTIELGYLKQEQARIFRLGWERTDYKYTVTLYHNRREHHVIDLR